MATKFVVSTEPARYVRAAQLAELRSASCLPVQVEGHTLALFLHDNKPYAVDNRCPHLGFPLHRGTVKDGVLTCHWHHARFDLASGGTFDQWADDVRFYPIQIRDNEVWVDLAPRIDLITHQQQRLRDGLERNIPLVIAKAVITLLDGDIDPAEPFRVGLEFGTHYRQAGWGQGAHHTHLHDELAPAPPFLRTECAPYITDCRLSPLTAPPRRRALGFTHCQAPLQTWLRCNGGSGSSSRCATPKAPNVASPRRCVQAPITGRWPTCCLLPPRTTVTSRSAMCWTSPIKHFEALDLSGWALAAPALISLATSYANADRMEESNSWRHPIDLIAILERAFEGLPAAIEEGQSRNQTGTCHDALLTILLGEDPAAIAEALLAALREGSTAGDVAGVVAEHLFEE